MKKKWLIIIILIVIVLAVAIYFIFFNKTTSNYFGLAPDFSSSASVGDNIEQATDTNSWKNAALNPFRDSS